MCTGIVLMQMKVFSQLLTLSANLRETSDRLTFSILQDVHLYTWCNGDCSSYYSIPWQT